MLRPAATSPGSETKAYKNANGKCQPSIGSSVHVVESFDGSGILPDPDVLVQEVVEDLEAALEQFREIAADLAGRYETRK